MKKLPLLFLSFFPLLGMGQTTLSAGDIAFVMFNNNVNPMTWAWVPLVDIESGTVIKFTDNGWDGVTLNSFCYTELELSTNNDDLLTFTATSAIAKGTVITVSGSTFTPNYGTVSVYGAVPPNSSSGDQILAYQGTFASPTFIAGVHADYNSSNYNTSTHWNSTNYNTTRALANSTLPVGLTDGSTCISLYPGITEQDFAYYSGATMTGTKAQLLALINNYSNWTSNNATAYTWTRDNFTVNVASPIITGISPTFGSTTGGTSVIITGTNLSGATAVKFGATNAASYTVNSATQITAASPAGSEGTVHITVTTSGGTTTTSSADQFTYLTPGTFTGASSNNWATAGNWAGGSVPTSATDVTIPAGKTAEIAPGTSAGCNNLTVDASGSLTIQSSSATNAGSLIVAGTATGNVTFQSYLAEAGKWHVVAAPVAAQNIWSFATLAGNSIAANAGKRAVTEYVEGTNTWDTSYPTADTEGSFSAGSGYSMLRSTAGIVSYTGTINTSNVSKPLTRTLYGWNALGNPYTSSINATETAHATNNLITANSASFDPGFAALYVWDAATNSYVTINNAGTGSLVQNYIQAGQGFFIRAKDNSGLNFSITEAMQTHQPTTPLKSGETVWPNILLQAEGSNKKSSTIIAFNQNMTTGLDITYDAGMLKADKNFALYSRLVDDNGVDFAIQALPENYDKLVIPMGIDVPAGTEVSFTAQAWNLPADAAVYLEDRAAKTITQLDVANAKYTVTITDKTKGTGNFFLHTNSATTAVNQFENNLKVYTSDRAIYISGNIETTDVVAVYSIVGKLQYKKAAEKTGLLRIETSNMPAGIYMVNIAGKSGQVTKKVVITE